MFIKPSQNELRDIGRFDGGRYVVPLSVSVLPTENSNNNKKGKSIMRKHVKITTEETCEYGSIALENWLLATMLKFAQSPEITKDHVDTMIARAVKLSEAGHGRTLTVAEDLEALAAGTPVAAEAAAMAAKAV